MCSCYLASHIRREPEAETEDVAKASGRRRPSSRSSIKMGQKVALENTPPIESAELPYPVRRGNGRCGRGFGGGGGGGASAAARTKQLGRYVQKTAAELETWVWKSMTSLT